MSGMALQYVYVALYFRRLADMMRRLCSLELQCVGGCKYDQHKFSRRSVVHENDLPSLYLFTR